MKKRNLLSAILPFVLFVGLIVCMSIIVSAKQYTIDIERQPTLQCTTKDTVFVQTRDLYYTTYWEWDDDDAADISDDRDGVYVEPYRSGYVTVSAKVAQYGDADYKTYKCEIRISSSDDYFDFSKNTYDVNTGDSVRLGYDYGPSENSSDFKFISSDTSIATVSSTGIVTGKKAGVVTITGWYGYAKDTCEVHVNDDGIEQKRLTDGVKYVPYYTQVDNYEITSDVSVRYELEGTLPSGLSLDPNTSVISGVPMTDGTWNFTVKRTSSNTRAADGVVGLPRSLTILSNTDSAVKQPIVNDYEIIIPVGTPCPDDPNHFNKYEYTAETLKIDGPYDEFVELYIDGRKLTRDVDYSAREGSTVITIHAQTFQRFGEGTHTIAAEFHAVNNGNIKVKRVAQNYTLTLGGSGNGGSSSSGGSSKASINTSAQKPQNSQKPTIPFTDVPLSAWYYEDVVRAYQEGVMQGLDGKRFGPDEKVSQATIVTVLARLAKIDMSQFDGETEPDVPEGQYYTAAAIWAKRSGLMPAGGAFTGSEVTTRNQMAVMLTKYLASMGKDTTTPAQPVTFADSTEMSEEGANAFQVLYKYGIFKGTGGMKMEPAGSTTRAQFAALIHRIYDTAVS